MLGLALDRGAYRSPPVRQLSEPGGLLDQVVRLTPQLGALAEQPLDLLLALLVAGTSAFMDGKGRWYGGGQSDSGPTHSRLTPISTRSGATGSATRIQSPLRARGLDHSPVPLLTKPFNNEQLVAMVQSVLDVSAAT